ncbi:LSU ribosomal protein L4p [Desulfocucumis palustris]|uniref:Large ribosomal subunit protein uL4 n=1 Tax=Desulfocucumis palustris TaxID=1898651 RepID=A0A2L2X7C0_9FIRM|nr:50S ribosomal protein L4 [Desulfocucumis palustris]GBF31890.1 LSU ribosomal protein L4p [Desulfocucumis palustris]
MPKVALYNISGDQVGEIELNDSVFGVPVHRSVMHDAVVAYLAGLRRGTHDTKTRAEVSGGGKKPWRQKGTGRARHGSIRSPIWRGGGIVFGPHPRDYSIRLPKKVRRLAIKSALSSKVEEGNILVLDDLKMEQPKTREMARILNNLKIDKKALVVIAGNDENVVKSARNIPGIKPVAASWLNVYDILAHNTLVITRDAVSRVEEVLAQ